MHKQFNPLEWANKPTQGNKNQYSSQAQKEVSKKAQEPDNDIERLIQQIEKTHIDLTQSYADWRNIGFALADEFGEAGRDYFHRISRFYSAYDSKECDQQFNKCLQSKGHGITLSTVFFLAKQSGISLYPKVEPSTKADNLESTKNTKEEDHTFADELYNLIPEFLKEVVSVADSKEEKDILLLGSIVSMSACLPNLFGIYHGNKLFPNLFLFITAQASAGKGRLNLCKRLVLPIHLEYRKEAKERKLQYDVDLTEYNSTKNKDHKAEKPAKPPEKMLFIPANNSSTGAYQLINDSEGKGLIFETEGDTLAKAFNSDYGDYSDGFRKAFHHETIAYYRRTDREMVEIESPKLSAVLSGTPMQISSLIPSAENGLFSRFIFYFMQVNLEWKNVFQDNSDEGLQTHFDHLGKEFYELYKSLISEPKVQFTLSQQQQNNFNQFFAENQEKYVSLFGLDYLASIRRLAVITFRISMVLSALRVLETGELSHQLNCTDEDFKASLLITESLLSHSAKVFSELPKTEKPKRRKNRKEKFLEALPKNFNRQAYLETAQQLNIPDKTAEGYITQFTKEGLVHREKKDKYLKP